MPERRYVRTPKPDRGTRSEVRREQSRCTEQPGGSRYGHSLYDSIDDVDEGAWARLRRGEHDLFMDPRFLKAIETSMAGTGRFRYVIFRDESSEPVASACMCSYRVDAALLADGVAKKLAACVGCVAPFLTHFNVVFCGVSFSAGHSNLRIAEHADADAVVRSLDRRLLEFAREERAKCIVFKEFTAEECERLTALTQLGYRRADSLPMNHTSPNFSSFEDYLAGLPSRKRYPIRRSRKKFANSGLRVVQMLGRDGADRIYTPDVHRLYEGVYNRAEVRLEKLPPATLPELARQLPDNTAFTFIYQGDRVVAFAFSLFSPEAFHQVFVGYDEELNPGCDLYFNLFFQAIDYAFRRNTADIFVGQSADDFKRQKLNCHQVPLYFYAKGVDLLSRIVIGRAFHLLFPPRGGRKDAEQGKHGDEMLK